MHLAEVIRHSRWQPAAARRLVNHFHRPHHQGRGIAFAIQYQPWAQPNIINSFASPATPGLWRGLRLPPFFLQCACV
jgi:hypothetical protein